MKRTIVFAATLLLASALPAFAQRTDKETELLNRLASGSGTAQVLVGKLPADMPEVPLPAGTIVGSVHKTVDAPISVESYDLYYDAAPSALESYSAALSAAGWKKHGLPGAGGGFVASSGPTTAIFCKEHAPLITAQLGSNPDDLRLSITESASSTDLLCGKNPLLALMKNVMRSPLPNLHAPAGVRMVVSQIPLPNAQSAAYFYNGSSAGALLDDFAAQMTAAGWHAGPKVDGTAIVSEIFGKNDEKNATWRCVISIFSVDDKPGEFVAFIHDANLTALSKGTSTLFQR